LKKILLKNLHIINPASDRPIIENAFVSILGDTIESVGSIEPSDEFDFVYDLREKLALPGMINAHHHLYSALAVGMPPPKNNPSNFSEILKEIWWKMDLALDRDSTKACFEAGMLDSLKSGTTTIIDHHCSPSYIKGSLSVLADTGEKMGLNTSLSFEISDRNGQAIFEESLEENINTVKEFSQKPYIHPMIGMHASFTLSDSSLEKIRNNLHSLDSWGIHIHVSEDKADEDDAIKKGYLSVIDRLDKFDLINEKGLIIHGVHILDEDINIINRHNAKLVHNPSSNANNRVGITKNKNLNMLNSGIGTDGMQGSILREGKEGILIRSSHLSGGMDNIDYMKLIFENNSSIASKLFGFKIGKILPGYKADLAIFDYQPRTPIKNSNIFGHIFFGLSGLPSDVITRGEFRIKDFKFQEISEKEIKENAVFQAERLWKNLS
tara:strand:+ start:103 stop:1416 length:1314 start_codon:yes stop_codon:yes gene_type:complete